MSLRERIREAKNFLPAENLVHVELELTDDETVSLRDFVIERELMQFDHYGPPDIALKERLHQYFFEAGKNAKENLERISSLILQLANEVKEGFEKDSAWVMARVTLPTQAFDIPRWHSDGRYFVSPEPVYKFVATLKGPRTLFAKPSDTTRFDALSEEIAKNYEVLVSDAAAREKFAAKDIRIRKELDGVVERIEGRGQAAIYRVGDARAATHSEPKMDVPRIFIAILPGSVPQIAEWKTKRMKRMDGM